MQQYLEAGKVVTTHGVRGEMKLELWCDGVDFLKKTGRLYASAKGGKCYNKDGKHGLPPSARRGRWRCSSWRA